MSETWTQRIERYIAEGRSVSGGKGDSAIKEQENQQMGFNNQLRSAFTKQFGQQSKVLDFLNQKLTSQVNNPTGFGAPALAAMRTGATEQSARDFAHAQQATNAAQAARGGSQLPSGVSAQLAAQNANAGAAENTSAQTGITLADENQKQSNYWNAVSGLNGVSQGYNPSGFGGLFNQGSGNVGQLGEAYNQTQQSQLMSTLGGVAGGVLGAAGNAGGFGKLFGGK